MAQTYKIQPNDTLNDIAKKYGVDVGALQQANNISNPNLIYAGATLDIPDFVDVGGSPKIQGNALVPPGGMSPSKATSPTVKLPVTNPELPSKGQANPIFTPNPPSSSSPVSVTSSKTSSSQVAVPPEYATLGITPEQYAQLNSSQGMDPLAYSSLINDINTRLSTNNELTTQKNLILQQMYGEKLTPEMMAKLPPDQQDLVKKGNKAEMEFQVRVLNDQISGRANTLTSSIQYLTQGYEKAQQQYNTEVGNVLSYAKALNAKPSEIMKALYPGDAARLGTALDALSAPLLTTTQVPNAITGGTAGYDLSSYATDPNYIDSVSTIVSNIGTISNAQDAQNYIDNTVSGAPITGDMVMNAASQYGVDPAVLMAQIQQESQFGTSNVAQVDNNPSGITWSQSYQDAHPGTSQGSPRPEGGNYVHFNNIQDGINANAEWLANHKVQGQAIDAVPPEPTNANIPDPVTGITPNGIYQAALDWAFAGKMIPTGIGTQPIPRAIRAAVVNKAAAIATASGTNFPAMQALYKANASAAKQNVERLARVESVMQATQLNFPRLAQLADQVKAQGLNITESDIQSGQAAVLSKFGSPEAASYVELINTIRSDYSAAQAALAGSRGGQFFAANAQEAIPIGLTSNQYNAIKDTLVLSSTNATQAINGEVQNLLGTSGSISQPSSAGSGGGYQDYLNAIQ